MKQHADGDEEDAREVIPERRDLGDDVVAVFRFGDDDPGEKGAQRQREAEAVGHPRSAEAEQHHEEKKHFAVPEADDLVEEERHDLARREIDAEEPQHRLAQGDEHRDRRDDARGARFSQDREHEHHGYDCDVLKQKDAGVEPSMRRVELGAVGVHLEHDGRAGEGRKEAEEHCLGQGVMEEGRRSRQRRRS